MFTKVVQQCSSSCRGLTLSVEDTDDAHRTCMSGRVEDNEGTPEHRRLIDALVDCFDKGCELRREKCMLQSFDDAL